MKKNLKSIVILCVTVLTLTSCPDVFKPIPELSSGIYVSEDLTTYYNLIPANSLVRADSTTLSTGDWRQYSEVIGFNYIYTENHIDGKTATKRASEDGDITSTTSFTLNGKTYVLYSKSNNDTSITIPTLTLKTGEYTYKSSEGDSLSYVIRDDNTITYRKPLGNVDGTWEKEENTVTIDYYFPQNSIPESFILTKFGFMADDVAFTYKTGSETSGEALGSLASGTYTTVENSEDSFIITGNNLATKDFENEDNIDNINISVTGSDITFSGGYNESGTKLNSTSFTVEGKTYFRSFSSN